MQLKWQISLWCLLAKISFKDFSPRCKMWKYEKTTNNWVFCIFTQSSQLLQICSENCPKSYLIQNINRSNGKHGGYFHFRQWRGGEVLILHFYLSSKFVSTYKIHQMSVPLQIHTNPHYKTFSEANLPFQGLRGSINEVRHFSNQTNLLKPLKLFKNTNKTEFYFVSGSLESASTRLQPSYGSFQLGNEVKRMGNRQ